MIIYNFDTNIIQVSENANFSDRNFTANMVYLRQMSDFLKFIHPKMNFIECLSKKWRKILTSFLRNRSFPADIATRHIIIV